jgi:hypothetical protein
MKESPVVSQNIEQDGPPSLNYDLRSRIMSNVIFWSTIVITLTIIPIALYYPLVFSTQLTISTILGIVSISSGLPSIIQLPYRIWQLWKQDNGDRRPLSGKIMDLFMWEYCINFVIIVAAYTVSTSIPIP